MKKLSAALSIFLALIAFLPPVAQADDRSVTVRGKNVTRPLLHFNTHYYAVIIGNNDYKYLRKLNTAVADAKAVEKLLKERYGFKTRLLLNATRKQILSTINEFRKELGEHDSLLIYYAGHGEYDRTADKAYWLPVDAQRDDPVDWIMADDITSDIKRIAAKHILLVSDSCYSGALSRAADTELQAKGEHEEFINKMMERPSRTLMASGGNEPVSDSGGGNHSVFAAAFIKALSETDKPVFTADEVFHKRIKVLVAGKSDQVPEYNDIKNSGNEGGDFVFQLAGNLVGKPKEIIAGPSVEDSSATEAPALELLGTFSYSGAGGADIAVYSSSQQVYIAGGMGQNGLIRINTANLAGMSQHQLSYGGGIAVDNATGRYATTSGYGSKLYVYNPDDTLYDTQDTSGCGGALDVDPMKGRFFISTQCQDHIAVYSEASRSLLANIACGGVGSSVVFDRGTGNIFENLTPNNRKGGIVAPLVLNSSTFRLSLPFAGFIQAADGLLKRLYVTNNNGDLLVLDSTTFGELHVLPGLNASRIVADTALSRFYTASGSTINVYDAKTFSRIFSLTLSGNIQNMHIAPGDSRLYAVDGKTLYIMQTGLAAGQQ